MINEITNISGGTITPKQFFKRLVGHLNKSFFHA